MKETLIVPAADERLDEVVEFVLNGLNARGCPEVTQLQIELAVEEIFVNIAHYAYPPGHGSVTVTREITPGGLLRVTLSDSGTAYDPLERPGPELSLPIEEKPEGGLGIFMARKSMDRTYYEHRGGKNILTLEKKLR